MSVNMKDVKKLREMTGAGIVDVRNALVSADGDVDKAGEILREKGLAGSEKKASRITAEGLVSVKTEGNRGSILEVNSETDFVAKNADFQLFVDELGELILTSEAENIEELAKVQLANGEDVETAVKSKIAKIGENIVVRRFVLFDDEETYVAGYNHGGRLGAMVELKADDKNVYTDQEFQQFGKDVAMQVTATSPLYVSKEDVPKDKVEHEREILIQQALNEADEHMPEDKKRMIAENKVKGRLNKQFYDRIVLKNQEFIKDSSYTIEKLLNEKAKKFAGLEVVRFVRYEVGEGLEKREEDFAAEVAKQMGN